MNDVQLDESSSNPTDTQFSELRHELQSAAAKSKIKELVAKKNWFNVKFPKTAADAQEQASHYPYSRSLSNGATICGNLKHLDKLNPFDSNSPELEPHTDGIVLCPRDSKLWSDNYLRYSDVGDDFEWFRTLQPVYFITPIDGIEAVVDAFDQGGLADNAQEIADNVQFLVESGGDASTLLSSEVAWGDIAGVFEALVNWNGYATDVFRMAIVDRLTTILLGQFSVSVALMESLGAMQRSFEGAKADACDLVQANIDAFDSEGIDVDWAKTLETISKIASTVADVATLIPSPPTVGIGIGLKATAMGIGKLAGSVKEKSDRLSKGSKLAASILKSNQDKNGTPDKLTVASGPADEVMTKLGSELDRIRNSLEGIESIIKSMLDSFLDLLNDKSPAALIHPAWASDGMILTTRQAYFEPKAPEFAGGSPGLTELGEQFEDDSTSNDPGFDTIDDPMVMGGNVYEGQGEDFGGELNQLYNAGHKFLPNLASRYAEVFGLLGDISIQRAFTRGDGDLGELYPSWCNLQDELHKILKGSSDNLESAGVFLTHAAYSFAERDEEAAEAIRRVCRANDVDPWI